MNKSNLIIMKAILSAGSFSYFAGSLLLYNILWEYFKMKMIKKKEDLKDE